MPIAWIPVSRMFLSIGSVVNPGIHKHITSLYSGSERIPDKLDGSICFVNHGLVIGKTGNQQHFVDVSGDPQDFSTAIRQCRKDSRNQYLTTDADGHLCYYHTLISVSTQEVQAVVRLSLKAKSLETLKTNHNSSHEKTGKDFMF